MASTSMGRFGKWLLVYGCFVLSDTVNLWLVAWTEGPSESVGVPNGEVRAQAGIICLGKPVSTAVPWTGTHGVVLHLVRGHFPMQNS